MIRKLCEPFLSIFIIAALFFIFASAVVQAEEFKFYIVDSSELVLDDEGEPLPRRSHRDDLLVSYRGEEVLITNEKFEYTFKKIFAEEDLDLDGHKELILKIHHGGNCCGYEYAIVSYRGENFFSITEHELLDGKFFPDVKIITNQGNPILKVHSRSEVADTVSQDERIILMQYKHGKLEVISESINAAMLPTLVEVNSYEFDQDEIKQIVKLFDADGDQTPDKLICSFWTRWASAVCDIDSSVNGYQEMSLGCKRIGVLSSETNGMQDLVCNRFSKLIFDGTKYQNVK